MFLPIVLACLLQAIPVELNLPAECRDRERRLQETIVSPSLPVSPAQTFECSSN